MINRIHLSILILVAYEKINMFFLFGNPLKTSNINFSETGNILDLFFK